MKTMDKSDHHQPKESCGCESTGPSRRRMMPLALLVVALLMPGLTRATDKPPAPYGPLPTANHLHWHEMEMLGLIHFGPNTFIDKQWGYGDASPEVFQPSALDTDQWARAAKAAGLRGLILVAKHHDGFCLWQTKTTRYSVAASPWMNGKGDLVESFVASCKRHGLEYGIYISPWDRNHAEYGRTEYVAAYHEQWRELLERHPGVFEVWFDGANGGDGYYGGAKERRRISGSYYRYDELFRKISDMAPRAVFFEGVGHTPHAVRYPGNEGGYLGDTYWSTYPDTVKQARPSRPEMASGIPPNRGGMLWAPAEADTPLLSPKAWFHVKGRGASSPAALMETYYATVGMGANLNLGLSPDIRGLLCDAQVEALAGMGKRLADEFKHELSRDAQLTSDHVRGNDPRFAPSAMLDDDRATYWATDDGVAKARIEIQLPERRLVNCLELGEAIQLGQRVNAFRLEGHGEGGWRELGAGSTIGRKRLLRFKGMKTDRLRLTVEAEATCLAIARLRLYRTPEYRPDPELLWDRRGFVHIKAGPEDQVFFAIGNQPSEKDFSRYNEKKPIALPKGGYVSCYAIDAASGQRSRTLREGFGLPNHRWKAVDSGISQNDQALSALIDADASSIWVTETNQNAGETPPWVEIDIGEESVLGGFTLLPRQDGKQEGIVDKYRFETRRNGNDPWKVAAEGEFSNVLHSPVEQTVRFRNPIRASHVRFTALHAIPVNDQASAAEIGLLAP